MKKTISVVAAMLLVASTVVYATGHTTKTESSCCVKHSACCIPGCPFCHKGK